MSESDGCDEFNQPLASELAKRRLDDLCSTHDESTDYSENSEIFHEHDPDKDMDFNAGHKWIDKILENVPIIKSKKYHDNLYYSGSDKNMYVKLFSSIVLWSNVMNPLFDSSSDVATSCDVESFFKSLKHGILQQKMCRADEFMELFVDFANAEIKINAMSNPNDTIALKKSKRSKSLDDKPVTPPGKYHTLIVTVIAFFFSVYISKYVYYSCHYIAKRHRSNSVHSIDDTNEPEPNSADGNLNLLNVLICFDIICSTSKS